MKHNLIETLTELASRDKDIVLITTDLSESTRIAHFKHQLIQCGRSDKHAIALAIGLAHEGKKPIIVTYSANVQGALEQLTLACVNDVNITIIATHAGLSSGKEGASTITLNDVAQFRSIPNLLILVPSDARQSHDAIISAVTHKGPALIRVPRTFEKAFPKMPFHVGKAATLRTGEDCTIISCGPLIDLALLAAERLDKQDITCTVLNSHTIKPLDKHGILSSVMHTGCAVTLEEHSTIGGLGSAVSELLSGENLPLEMLGTPDTFGESATPVELLGKYGLTVEHVVQTVKSAIARKCKTPCTSLHEQHAQFLVPPPTEKHFRIQGGGVVRTIPELAAMLPAMDDVAYSHHAKRGDFSNWIADVFKQKNLATLIAHKKNKLAMASAITRWLR